mmetsp:Transcript_146963/g.208373  ORF Transcript_146963/g.208373 Transcript_146963/m.208373 type:complete len:216 (+) Transcript_146963:56-703(+)|eukprot:symbB.v1.2.018264.t1/scaffold1446.1/size211836/7
MAHLLLSLMAMWSLTSATVNDCIETACRGCSGEQCQLCREDTNTVSACVANCMDLLCKGCGGEQCQLCREDAKTIESCCSEQVLALATVEVESCKAKPQDPCDGLYGAEGLQCAWQEDAKTCIENSCKGCSGEQCQLCRSDAQRIASCCDDHYHSVDPPQMCKDSKEEAVTSCFDTKCRGCSGEQCQLCREDAKSECCTGAMRTPSCESSKSLLP